MLRTAAIITTDCVIGGYCLLSFIRLDLDLWMMLSNILQAVFCLCMLQLTRGKVVG